MNSTGKRDEQRRNGKLNLLYELSLILSEIVSSCLIDAGWSSGCEYKIEIPWLYYKFDVKVSSLLWNIYRYKYTQTYADIILINWF